MVLLTSVRNGGGNSRFRSFFLVQELLLKFVDLVVSALQLGPLLVKLTRDPFFVFISSYLQDIQMVLGQSHDILLPVLHFLFHHGPQSDTLVLV
jgi:hypothetical protein